MENKYLKKIEKYNSKRAKREFNHKKFVEEYEKEVIETDLFRKLLKNGVFIGLYFLIILILINLFVFMIFS